MHPKTIVYGIEVGGVSKAYAKDVFEKGKRIEDVVNGTPVLISRLPSGRLFFRSKILGEKIIARRMFWFAWSAFYPNSLVYSRQSALNGR
ncbi:MAG: hypothetical protein ACI9BD_001268 [Candidatus Marinamargulisbacteria bacterium]|jgi:hypothetical protein